MSDVILVFNFQTNGTAMKLIGNGCYIYNKTIKEKEDSLLEIVTLFTQTLRLVHIYIVWVKCLMWIWVSRFRFNSRNIIFCEWHWETIVTVVLAPYKNDILIYLFGCPCSKDILFKGV